MKKQLISLLALIALSANASTKLECSWLDSGYDSNIKRGAMHSIYLIETTPGSWLAKVANASFWQEPKWQDGVFNFYGTLTENQWGGTYINLTSDAYNLEIERPFDHAWNALSGGVFGSAMNKENGKESFLHCAVYAEEDSSWEWDMKYQLTVNNERSLERVRIMRELLQEAQNR